MASLVAALVAPTGDAYLFFAILAAVAIVAASSCRMTLVIDADTIAVRSTLLRFAWKTFPLTAIEHVREDHVSALAWGGWGYRIQPGRSAAIMRSGPGLIILLANGREFTITVPDPAEVRAIIDEVR